MLFARIGPLLRLADPTAAVVDVGAFCLVQLQRRGTRAERHFIHDSAQHLYRTAAEVSDSVAIKEIQAVDRREKRHTPWRWMAAALVLLLFMGFLARRFFR